MSKKKGQAREVHSRDEHYMGEAFLASAKSKDPRTQVGCVIISSDNRPLGWGYNGPPKNIPDYDVDWDRPHKYHLIRHAEKNAIRYSGRDLKNAVLYCTDLPCPTCMLDIVAEEIARVVYFPSRRDPSSMLNVMDADHTREIAKLGRVSLDEFKGNLNWMRDHLERLHKLGIF